MKFLSSCTIEGIIYAIQCYRCRQEGRRRIYVEESSGSSNQRSKEHFKEIKDRNAAHPLGIHFQEDNGGEAQKISLRVLSSHRSAMEHQVAESVWIEEEMG